MEDNILNHVPAFEISSMKAPLRTLIKLYTKRSEEMENYLTKHPNDWSKFQDEFNNELNGIFNKIIEFERINMAHGREDRVYKLKQLFIERFRPLFARGIYCDWSIRKPFGYAGDFKIIDDIYQNNPSTNGFDRLFDNYFQMSAISVAVRNRKDEIKRQLSHFINFNKSQINIMNLACGSCRDIQELLSSEEKIGEKAVFDCYDNDERALEYAQHFLSAYDNVNLIKENALRIAFRRNINDLINKRYNFIYSAGLFDYFNEKIAIRVVSALRNLLSSGGCLFIANVRDKYSNPSTHFMEWAGDWNLVYRDEAEFRNIFLEAGFKENNLRIKYEQQGIIQYMLAANNE